MAKKPEHAQAVLAAMPGGEDWKAASPTARVLAGALLSVSTALDDIGNIATATDSVATELGGIGRMLSDLTEEIGNVAQDITRTLNERD